MIEFTPMISGELVCLLPEAHPFAERESISIRDVAGMPLISLASDEPSRRVAADLFTSTNQISDIAFRALSATSVQALVKAGLGVALVDHFTLFEELTPGVAARRLAEPTFFATGIATRRDKELSQAAREFIGLFAKETATAAAAMRERLDRSGRKPPQAGFKN
jgi:DNA-binding transcriptional LysR family regulator